MKRLFIILAVSTLLPFLSSAQGVRFAPFGGLNIAKYSKKVDDSGVSNASVTGVHIGVLIDKPLGKSFHLMPGLFYSRKGAKWDYYENAALVTVTESLSYIEIPLNIAYRAGASKNLFVFAGPYLAYAVDGDIKHDMGPLSNKKGIEFGNERGMYKRLDLGFNLGAGYELPMGLSLRLNYVQGLSNILGAGDSGNAIKNQVISVSVGYFLRSAK